MAYVQEKTVKSGIVVYRMFWRSIDPKVGKSKIYSKQYTGDRGHDGAIAEAKRLEAIAKKADQDRLNAANGRLMATPTVPFLLSNREIAKIWDEFGINPILEDGNDLPFYVETVYGLIDPKRYRLNRPPYLYIGSTNSISNEKAWDEYYGSGTHLRRVHPKDAGRYFLQRIIIHPLTAAEAKDQSAFRLEQMLIQKVNANSDPRFFNGRRWSEDEKNLAERENNPNAPNKVVKTRRGFEREELLKRDFFNLAEFEFLTGLSTTHIRDHLIKKGIIEAAKLGGVWVIPTDQLAVLREHVRAESQKRRDNPE